MARLLCYLLVAVNAVIFWAAVYLPAGGESARVPLVPEGAQVLQRTNEEVPPVAVWPGQKPDACYRLSGFSSPEQARQWLSEHGVTDDIFTVVPRSTAAPPYYWVLQTPDNGSLDAAQERVVRHQSEGIESYLVSQGPWRGRISFGLYSAPERAAHRLAELAEQGVEAEVVERPRERVFYAVEGGEALAQIGTPPYLTRSGAIIVLQPCEGVAKVRQNP